MRGYTDQGLPFSGRSPLARSCSHKAAVRASSRRGPKTDLYLAILAVYWPLIDHEAHALLKTIVPVAFSSIQSIRNATITCHLVRDSGTTKDGPYGLQCTAWEVTEAGRAVASQIQRRLSIQIAHDGTLVRRLL